MTFTTTSSSGGSFGPKGVGIGRSEGWGFRAARVEWGERNNRVIIAHVNVGTRYRASFRVQHYMLCDDLLRALRHSSLTSTLPEEMIVVSRFYVLTRTLKVRQQDHRKVSQGIYLVAYPEHHGLKHMDPSLRGSGGHSRRSYVLQDLCKTEA